MAHNTQGICRFVMSVAFLLKIFLIEELLWGGLGLLIFPITSPLMFHQVLAKAALDPENFTGRKFHLLT